jgi:hypothetical protein
VHEEKVESKKESLESLHPWRENSRACWSIYGAFWSRILKRDVVRHKE